MKQRTTSAERLLLARKQASKELRLPVDSPLVQRYAVLKVAFDGVQARVASGAEIDIDNLLKLETAMAEIRATKPQEPVAFKLTIVGNTNKDRRCRACEERFCVEPTCTKCGFRQTGDLERWREQRPTPALASAPECVAVEPDKAVAPAAPAQPPRRNPGSIHDAPGARMAPSRTVGGLNGGGSGRPFGRTHDVGRVHTKARRAEQDELERIAALAHVRFTPKSGHRLSLSGCPLCAKS